MLPDTLCFILADDHPLMRNGISQVLKSEFPNCVVEETANSAELLEAVSLNNYDVIFIDISMPGMKGSEAARRIKERKNHAKIIALSYYDDATSVVDMFENGAVAYLSKASGKDEIVQAVQEVLKGMYYVGGPKTNHLLSKYLNYLRHSQHHLSPREKEILLLICQGFSTKEVAEKLHLAYKTIDNHRTHLLEKIGVNNTAGLVLYASKKGWV